MATDCSHPINRFSRRRKTTLLRHINEQHGFKIAVIENEFGEVAVDDQLIGDRAPQIKTLTNGCIAARAQRTGRCLLDLLDSRDRGIAFDRLVIECTGMADPIIQTFFSHEALCERYLLDGVIALVDAVHADQQMDQFTICPVAGRLRGPDSVNQNRCRR